MIKSVTIKNFKSIKEQTYRFTNFDLLVGRNNSGKSSILQALAIWQYCVDEFRRNKSRRGLKGIQIVLPNFTALPVPEFNLLWTDKTERKYIPNGGKKTQEYILIEIDVEWELAPEKANCFAIQLRYQTPQSSYAIPVGGWKRFKQFEENHQFPRVVYVPPFSGLETYEKWSDESVVRQQVGKAQPGSVLRNLLYRIVDKADKAGRPIPFGNNTEWNEVQRIIRNLFSIEINPPLYEKGIDTQITCTYMQKTKQYDIIAGGSGFHQTLTLLAFLYGYKGLSTICFDEPDAHMHTNLQREMLEFFRLLANQRNIQFIIATHSEELIKAVPPTNLYSVLKTAPERIEANDRLLTALSDVGNVEIAHAMQSPFILYIEGETDERLIRSWANVLNNSDVLGRYFCKIMGGGSKKDMKENADRHFNGLSLIIPNVKRLMVFDYDSDETAFSPQPGNPALFEWNRKNIENYLLVNDAWRRVATPHDNMQTESIFKIPVDSIIQDFFIGENLSLPKNVSWENVDANIFKVVDGKRLLFDGPKSLFNRLKEAGFGSINREDIAQGMIPMEIHNDIKFLFKKMEDLLLDE